MKAHTEHQTLAYSCMNAIGNSLVLDEMLNDVISTFVCHAGASGGTYLSVLPSARISSMSVKTLRFPLR